MSAPVREGETLAGKYRIERVIGEGGMGVVVCATHMQLDQLVAIKFLLPEGLAKPEVVGRFAREARAAAKIRSEHVARVIDVSALENGAPYMVMEYLEGRDLADTLLERRTLPVDEATTYILQACEAIAEAHVAGIVHRDLKPANLFLATRADHSRTVKVLDFGISKMNDLGGKDFALTKTATILGSPLYMSPEQLGGAKDLDQRADIWALGVILYELTTGEVPFGGESLSELIVSVLQRTPTSMCSLRPEIPPAFEAVVLRCLAKDRAGRFANVAELAGALQSFSRDQASISYARVSRILGTTQPGIAPPPSSGPTSQMPASSPSGTLSADRGSSAGPPPTGMREGEASGPLSVAKTQGAWAQVTPTPGGATASQKKSAAPLILGGAAIVAGSLAAGAWFLRSHLGPGDAATTSSRATVTATVAATTPAPSIAPATTTATASASPTTAPTATATEQAPVASAAPPRKREEGPKDRRHDATGCRRDAADGRGVCDATRSRDDGRRGDDSAAHDPDGPTDGDQQARDEGEVT